MRPNQAAKPVAQAAATRKPRSHSAGASSQYANKRGEGGKALTPKTDGAKTTARGRHPDKAARSDTAGKIDKPFKTNKAQERFTPKASAKPGAQKSRADVVKARKPAPTRKPK